MKKPYVRVVRRPTHGDLGSPQSRSIKRIEVIDGDRTINLPCQDLNFMHPVAGVSYLQITTPYFTEVIEHDGAEAMDE